MGVYFWMSDVSTAGQGSSKVAGGLSLTTSQDGKSCQHIKYPYELLVPKPLLILVSSFSTCNRCLYFWDEIILMLIG